MQQLTYIFIYMDIAESSSRFPRRCCPEIPGLQHERDYEIIRKMAKDH